MRDALAPVHTDILWNTERTDLPHPNTMELRSYKNGALTGEMTALSVGGGAISIPGRPDTESPEVYPETSYAEISAFCSANPAAAERLCVSAGRGGYPGLSL